MTQSFSDHGCQPSFLIFYRRCDRGFTQKQLFTCSKVRRLTAKTNVYSETHFCEWAFTGSLGVHSHDWLVILGPGDDSGWAGLHLADEGGVVVQQDVHGLQ